MEIMFNCEENTAKIKLLGDPSENILKFLCGLVHNNNVWFVNTGGTALFDYTLNGKGELTTQMYSIYSHSLENISPKTLTIKILNGYRLLD